MDKFKPEHNSKIYRRRGTKSRKVGHTYRKYTNNRAPRVETEEQNIKKYITSHSNNRMSKFNRKPTVKFTEKWGRRSWKVEHTCKKYTNDRIPHVEVGEHNIDQYKSGDTFTLSNLHCNGKAIMWDVDGCKNGPRKAHFTVAFLNSPQEARNVLSQYH